MFYSGAIGFFGGVAVSSVFSPNFYLSLSVFIFSAFLLLFLKIFRPHSVLLVAVLFIAMFAVGVARVSLTSPMPTLPSSVIEGVVVLRGIVIDEPERREKSTLFTFEVSTVSQSGNEWVWDGKVRVTADRYENISYGEELFLTGGIKQPENFETSGGRVFDYGSYLENQGVSYVMAFPKIKNTGINDGNFLKKNLFTIKNYFLGELRRAFPEPESSLLGGLLLGVKESIPENVLEAMQRAGVVHIIVLSGYNVTLVAEAIMRLFGFFSLRTRLTLGGVTIALFAVMTGGSASVIRASVMAILVLLARATGRTYAILRALVMAGVCMVFWNPSILISDLSFQLSFLATLGLITVSPPISRALSFLPERGGWRDYAASTLGTQVAVLPLLLYSIGTLSFLALPANILMLPLIPLAMLFGFFAVLVSFVHPYLALPIVFIAYLFLKYEIFISTFLGTLPFAAVSIPPFPLTVLLIAYTLFFCWIFGRADGNKKTSRF